MYYYSLLQFGDSKIANILESNGAGGCWLDYDGDGLVDLFLVNSGPLDGITHHPAGTVREPNRLYRNRGDGTFEDVTERAGLNGAGYCSAAIAAEYVGWTANLGGQVRHSEIRLQLGN